jgi:SAM-dependent methyltransferase
VWLAVALGVMSSSQDLPDSRWIERWRASIEGSDVLELGCGSGSDTRHIERIAKSVICSDIRQHKPDGTRSQFVQLDHGVVLPFSIKFDVVVASLCLHYFRWEKTKRIIREIARVLASEGLLICRLNSAEDHNFGASGYSEIEPGLYDVGGAPKRFFHENDILELFSKGWILSSIEHKCIDRYEEPKWVWEFGANYS